MRAATAVFFTAVFFVACTFCALNNDPSASECRSEKNEAHVVAGSDPRSALSKKLATSCRKRANGSFGHSIVNHAKEAEAAALFVVPRFIQHSLHTYTSCYLSVLHSTTNQP